MDLLRVPAWVMAGSSWLTVFLPWVCFLWGSGLVPEPKSQMEEDRERGLRPGARGQGAHGRGDTTPSEEHQFSTPRGPGPEQEGSPGGPAEVRLAGLRTVGLG